MNALLFVGHSFLNFGGKMTENSTFKKTVVPIFIDNGAIFNLGFLSRYVTTQLNGHVVL